MKKIGAEFILGAMVLPVFVWIFSNIIDLKSSYASIETKSESNKDDIQEIKSDVKFIRQYLMEHK